jgi:hypothetical protein
MSAWLNGELFTYTRRWILRHPVKLACEALGRFWRGIRSLIVWFPFVWRNEGWWDYSDLLGVMRFMLAHMQEGRYHEKHGARLALLLLNRLNADEYDEQVFALHNEKWGKPEITITPSGNWYTHRAKVQTEKELVQELEEFNRAIRHAKYLREQDLRLLCTTLERHLFEWWD